MDVNSLNINISRLIILDKFFTIGVQKMILLELFFAFFKVGLFSIGGGLATLPFLYELTEKYDWITVSDISNLVAISESTPGPLGINMATYVGFLQSGVAGAVIASLGLVVPSTIIIIVIAKFLSKFKNSKTVKDVFTVSEQRQPH